MPLLAGKRTEVDVVLPVLADGRTKAVVVLPEAEISCQTPFNYWIFFYFAMLRSQFSYIIFYFHYALLMNKRSLCILAETKFFKKPKKTNALYNS
jgi:hypothetical protein